MERKIDITTPQIYRRSLETVFPEIGAIKLNRLRPIALENLLAKLRKRTYRGKPIKEKTVQKYLTVVSAVLSDAKRNEITEKNPCPHDRPAGRGTKSAGDSDDGGNAEISLRPLL